MCRSMVDIQSPTAEIRRGKKKKIEGRKKEERNYRMKILWSALLHRATIIMKLLILTSYSVEENTDITGLLQ